MANDTYLDEPLLEDTLKTPYFFNGRLLSQEDLTQGQTAERARRQHLARALGSGISYGLEVERASVPNATNIVLGVAPGLAIAPDGDVLHLPEFVPLRFSVRVDVAGGPSTASDDFSTCGGGTPTVSVARTGSHLLLIRPTYGKQGLAPVSGLGNEAAPCNTKYRTSGVSFRAVQFSTTLGRGATTFRSALALDCFGFLDERLVAALGDPFTGLAPLELPVLPSSGATAAPGYGRVDALRAAGAISCCEVPLAVVDLNDNGTLNFVDVWPVRRSLVQAPVSRHFWPFGASGDRRRAEAGAAMLHFQDHVAALIATEPALGTMKASDRFAFLPGGGFLPVGTGRFDPPTFFGEGAAAVVDADFGRLRALVEESMGCEPMPVTGAVLPPITYFAFPEAVNRWVFFLRRRTDPIEVDPDPDDGDGEPGSPPPPPPPPGPTPSVKTRSIVAVVSPTWVKKHGAPRAMLLPRRGTFEEQTTAQKEALLTPLVSRTHPPLQRKPALARLLPYRVFLAEEVPLGTYEVTLASDSVSPFRQSFKLTSGTGPFPVFVE